MLKPENHGAYFTKEVLQTSASILGFDYPGTPHDPSEQAFRDYEYERWLEDPERWSPLINLAQLEARPDLEMDYYCPDWVPVGAKTIISAEPKTGKTILLFHILKAIVEGEKFLGKQCHPARVLFLSELTEMELKRQVKEVPGLLGNKNFYVLLPEETPSHIKTWEDTIEFAEKMLALTKSKILVVDTFGSLAKLPPGGENDSATIQNSINKLSSLFKNRYLSIILTHHNRKKSDDPRSQGSNLTMNAARGSSAFIGGGGHLIYMSTIDRSNKRQFSFFGRYNHGMERTLILTDTGYEEVQGAVFGKSA